MAFRNQLDAANAKNQRLQEQLERAEEENRQLKQKRAEVRPLKRAQARQKRAKARRAWANKIQRRFENGQGYWAVSAMPLGSLVALGTWGDGFGPSAYEWFEAVAYLTASTSLLVLGILYFISHKLGRRGLLGWSVAALALELVDMGLEVALFGQVSSWFMSAIFIAYPAAMLAAFLRSKRNLSK